MVVAIPGIKQKGTREKLEGFYVLFAQCWSLKGKAHHEEVQVETTPAQRIQDCDPNGDQSKWKC